MKKSIINYSLHKKKYSLVNFTIGLDIVLLNYADRAPHCYGSTLQLLRPDSNLGLPSILLNKWNRKHRVYWYSQLNRIDRNQSTQGNPHYRLHLVEYVNYHKVSTGPIRKFSF